MLDSQVINSAFEYAKGRLKYDGEFLHINGGETISEGARKVKCNIIGLTQALLEKENDFRECIKRVIEAKEQINGR